MPLEHRRAAFRITYSSVLAYVYSHGPKRRSLDKQRTAR
jgi:hypothetical protein